ncbi:MAG: glycosyltransferase family 2 protein [Polyangia bacterium]
MNVLEIVAAAALILLAYTYFGYPLLLGVLARLFPWRPRPDATWEPTVSLCVAAYNAEPYIEAKLRSLLGQDYPADKVEILVYSDGSTDTTESIVAAWAQRDSRISLMRGETRQGKPTALNHMREQATGEVLVMTDARQPLDSGALRALLPLLAAPEVGCVTGNLVLDGAEGSGAYWRYENWIRKQESRFGSLVGVTGALAALRRRDLGPLAVDLVLDDMWIAMQTRRRRARVLLAEGAIVHDLAFSDEREFGRKARSLAGNYQLFWRMPGLLLPLVNPSWFETVSHKVSRLLCPWALLALLLACAAGAAGLSSEGTPRAALSWLLLAQIVFYALAGLGARAGRIGVLARTFVVLNAAALVGLWRFLAGRQKITW